MTRDLWSLNLLAKPIVLHRHNNYILLSLATAAIAEAILMRTSAEQMPPLHRVAPSYSKLVTSSTFMLIFALMSFYAAGRNLALFCADFHSIWLCSVHESIGEVLKFTIAATNKIDVSKSQATNGPATNTDGCVVFIECFPHNLLKEKVEQDGSD